MLDPGDAARISALESRVTAIETQIGYLTARVDRAEGKLDAFADRITRAEEKINHLPSKGFIVTAVMGALALLGALILFQANLRASVGAADVRPPIPSAARP